MMRTIQYFALMIALAIPFGNLCASETSDLFASKVADMSSDNQDARKNAQQDWQRHCLQNGNNETICKEACQLMTEQIAKDTPVETKVWLIRQLGYIGDDAVVPALAKAFADQEIRVSDEAARALANIATDAAKNVLADANTKLAQAALHETAVDRNILLKYNDETQMPMAIPYVSAKKVAEWMKGYNSLDDLAKAQTLASLAVRRDGAYIKQALEGLKSNDDVLRDAAILAVGTMGSSREIQVLLDQVFEGGNKDLAKLALIRMNDRMLDARLLGSLESENDLDRFQQIADVLKNRDNSAALPVILKKANAQNSQDRLGLMQIGESLASKENIGDFVDIWEKITDRGQKDQAEQVIARLVNGDSAPVLQKRTDKNYADMFSLLGRIGDDKSLEEIRNRVFDKPLPQGMTASAELSASALRAMCNWPNARVADDLVQVVKSSDFSNQERLSALRGYIRVVSLPNDRIGIDVQEPGKVKMLSQAIQLSVRNEEKRLVIQRAGQVRHADSLEFIMQYFDNAELQRDVCNAVVELSHHVDLRNSAKEEFKSALDKVLETSKDQGLLDRAKRYRDAM